MSDITQTRRRLLTSIGVAGGLVLAPGIVAARSDGSVPGRAPEAEVAAFPNVEAPAGHWLVHRIGFLVHAKPGCTTVAQAKADLERFVDLVSVEATIDGEFIEDDDGDYWVGPMLFDRDDEGNETYFVDWRYATPPKPPGSRYRFEMTLTFDEPWEAQTYNHRDEECQTTSPPVEVNLPEYVGGSPDGDNVTIVHREGGGGQGNR